MTSSAFSAPVQTFYTAEHVSEGHPDKFCDQVADQILDAALSFTSDETIRKGLRTAIECLAKDNLLIVSGEVKMPPEMIAQLDVSRLAREVWEDIGYGSDQQTLTVIDHIGTQSLQIASSEGTGRGVDDGGAGDQGIMVGYATDETPEMMPKEWMIAQKMCWKLRELRRNGMFDWLESDCKTQVTLDEQGEVTSVIIAAQHKEHVAREEIHANLVEHVVNPVLAQYECEVDPAHIHVNGCGSFVIGGPAGDAGVVGRKIVVDAYGPRVPVGGGAYSGKDPTKVDRSAAYMARHIAKNIVADPSNKARACLVQLAYGIGQLQPEMVSAVTDKGEDVSAWVHKHFPDLSPAFIIEYLHLRNPQGWSYRETAAYGHYGRAQFPWEQLI